MPLPEKASPLGGISVAAALSRDDQAWVLQGSQDARTTLGAISDFILQDSNINSLTSLINALTPIGTVFHYHGTNAPVNFLALDGRTIGNPSSGATARAAIDVATLYAMLWADSSLTITTSGGLAATRGANAEADFNAGKRIALPDDRGATEVMLDYLVDGNFSNRINGNIGPNGLNVRTLNGNFGSQTHALTSDENGPHTHTTSVHTDIANGSNVNGMDEPNGGSIVSRESSSSGLGQPHNNVQPSKARLRIIRAY